MPPLGEFEELVFPLLPAVALAMARPAGIALVLPVFTRAQLGGAARAGFALALALPIVPPASAALQDGLGGPAWFLVVSAKEAFAGVIIGVLFGMPIWAMQSAQARSRTCSGRQRQVRLVSRGQATRTQ